VAYPIGNCQMLAASTRSGASGSCTRKAADQLSASQSILAPLLHLGAESALALSGRFHIFANPVGDATIGGRIGCPREVNAELEPLGQLENHSLVPLRLFERTHVVGGQLLRQRLLVSRTDDREQPCGHRHKYVFMRTPASGGRAAGIRQDRGRPRQLTSGCVLRGGRLLAQAVVPLDERNHHAPLLCGCQELLLEVFRLCFFR
jgi:hypothetical protein